MKKKIVSLCLVVALLAVAIAGATLAYFTDTDEALNTMTVGKVDITQNEQERDANGNLVPFTQDKPLVPFVGDIAWSDSPVTIGGVEQKTFAMNNVIDKFVNVSNVGKTDAWIRTIIAMEAPDGFNDDLLGVNVCDDYAVQSPWAYYYIDGTRYVVSVFTYNDALAAGKDSAVSLAQIYLSKVATNEDVELLGNTFEVLALTQAVQKDGFADATTGLDEAFGPINADNINAWMTPIAQQNTNP